MRLQLTCSSFFSCTEICFSRDATILLWVCSPPVLSPRAPKFSCNSACCIKIIDKSTDDKKQLLFSCQFIRMHKILPDLFKKSDLFDKYSPCWLRASSFPRSLFSVPLEWEREGKKLPWERGWAGLCTAVHSITAWLWERVPSTEFWRLLGNCF